MNLHPPPESFFETFDSSHIAILGAGLMGTAIAAAHLQRGFSVLLYDSVPESLRLAPVRIAEELRLQRAAFLPERLRCCGELEDVVRCSILVETITEKHKAKQKLYRQLQQAVPKNGSFPFLFSNTSTISISSLAEGLDGAWRSRFCGFHFFHPVRERSLLEIIAGRETALETIDAAQRHAVQIDKQSVLVGDGPGFLVNRILNPYLTSALLLIEEGVDLKRIERIATSFGMKMGPFRIMDEIGLDVVLHAGWVLYKAFPERVAVSSILLKLIEQGRLGRKTGRGFMLYPSSTSWDGAPCPDPELTLLENHAGDQIDDLEIVRRLFFSMYEEALRCREDGIISNLADADLASVHALGFPAESGGIIQWGKKFLANKT